MSDDVLRAKLSGLLRGGDAARPTTDILRAFPYDRAGVVLDGLPYSAWSLVEHLRISQEDIVEFSRGPGHESPAWPDEYWPESTVPESEAVWNASIEAFESDLQAMIELVEDEDRDLLAPFPWGEGQNLLREAVMLAEHNSYHGGQLVLVARLLGVWA
ncbi:MAG: DinB family protein [Gemmatimonadota bacterium]